jgi:hypothetical protein
MNGFANPEGIESSSPGLAALPEGQPWVIANKRCKPEWFEYQALMNRMQPGQAHSALPKLRHICHL